MKYTKYDIQRPNTNNYEKYQTRNPFMRWIIKRFLKRLRTHVEHLRPASIVDLGCGEGIVANTLVAAPFNFKYLGLEINPESVLAAREVNPGMVFYEADILNLEPQTGWADMALCIEVLEHVKNPRAALEKIVAWTSKYAIISVPWEPYFRIGNLLRGKYVANLGNHPEHIQQFNANSLRLLLQEFFEEVTIHTCFPWLLSIGRGPKRHEALDLECTT